MLLNALMSDILCNTYTHGINYLCEEGVTFEGCCLLSGGCGLSNQSAWVWNQSQTKHHLSCHDTMAVFVAKLAAGSEPGRREKGDWEDPIQVKYTPALYFNAIAAVEGVGHTQTASRAAIFFPFTCCCCVDVQPWTAKLKRMIRAPSQRGKKIRWVQKLSRYTCSQTETHTKEIETDVNTVWHTGAVTFYSKFELGLKHREEKNPTCLPKVGKHSIVLKVV